MVKAIAPAAEAEAIPQLKSEISIVIEDGANLLYLERLHGAQISSADVAQGEVRASSTSHSRLCELCENVHHSQMLVHQSKSCTRSSHTKMT